jgi:hypothetical protein
MKSDKMKAWIQAAMRKAATLPKDEQQDKEHN